MKQYLPRCKTLTRKGKYHLQIYHKTIFILPNYLIYKTYYYWLKNDEVKAMFALVLAENLHSKWKYCGVNVVYVILHMFQYLAVKDNQLNAVTGRNMIGNRLKANFPV